MLKQQRSNLPLYVGITSIPGRELSLIESLDAINDNSVLPSRIFVTLFKKYRNYEQYDLSYINDYKETHNNVQVIMLDDDLGPCSKLLGLLPYVSFTESRQHVLLVDDDHIYKSYLIETCQAVAQSNLNFCGSYYVYQVGELTVGQGADGFLINAKLLKDFREYYDFLMLNNHMWFYHDDFVISSFLFNKGISINDMRHLLKPNDKYIYSFASGHSIHGLNKMTGVYERRTLNQTLLKLFNDLYPEKLLRFR